MKDVIGSILPLAIAVTISPIPIIAEILLLFTKKPVANAASYLAGFILGVAGVLAILVAIAGTIDLSAGSGPSKGASILQLVLGALLLAAALRQFRGRPKPGQEAVMPKWMNGIAGFAPGKSLLVGVGIGALNPKNVIVGVAAAVAIASASLSIGQEVGASAVVTGQVSGSAKRNQAAAGIQGWPLVSITRASKNPSPCLAAVDR